MATKISDPRSQLLKEIKQARLITALVFPFEPVAASRPKVSRWGVYYGKRYKEWRELATEHIASVGADPIDRDTPLLTIVQSVSTKARTSKLWTPNYDVDNSAKGPLDIITKAEGYWHDDKQCVTLVSAKRFAGDGEDAHMAVHIYALPQ